MAGVKPTKSGNWQAWYFDWQGKRRWFTSSESKKKTLTRVNGIEEEH